MEPPMANPQRPPMRPMRVVRRGALRGPSPDLPTVPEQGTISLLASNRRNPTEGNGSGLAREELHIALIAPEGTVLDVFARHARLIRPPLWEGKVFLHVIPEGKVKNDPAILQYLIDSGDISAESAGMSVEVVPVSAGYPASVTRDA
jgi:hypothetical protein